jgi:hypothetical protein
MNYPNMSEEEVRELLDQNPDIKAEEDFLKEKEESKSIVPVKDWKHTIYMGLIDGLLWAVAGCSLLSGLVVLLQGIMDNSGLKITGGILFLVVGIAVGVCARLFHDKVKYGEV